MSQPLIAVSPNHLAAEDRRLYKGKALEYGEAELAGAIARAGGIPVMVYRADPAHVDDDADAATAQARTARALAAWAETVMARCDGLVLSGGADIAPEVYGETAREAAWRGDHARDALEVALYRSAVAAGKPVLGVCRGAQLIGVAEGGSLWQDLPSMREGSLEHRSQALYDALDHGLEIDAGAEFLASIFDGEEARVNSVHHQGLRMEPASLRVLARAPDGLAESFVRDDAWVLAVQWHPEWMQARPSQRRLFERFVAAARRPGELPWS
jgi:putative glutamine amidotransferase